MHVFAHMLHALSQLMNKTRLTYPYIDEIAHVLCTIVGLKRDLSQQTEKKPP